jgi:hypothetical protein
MRPKAAVDLPNITEIVRTDLANGFTVATRAGNTMWMVVVL